MYLATLLLSNYFKEIEILTQNEKKKRIVQIIFNHIMSLKRTHICYHLNQLQYVILMYPNIS